MTMETLQPGRCGTAEAFAATRRFLLETKGFFESDLTTHVPFTPEAVGDRQSPFVIDFLISLVGRPAAIVVCAPGWISNLSRAATAAARLLAETVIPLSVVTNGDQVEIVDSLTGRVIGSRLDDLPDRDQLAARLDGQTPRSLDESRRQKEGRILAAYQALAGAACGR
jgi:hypothetical protein